MSIHVHIHNTHKHLTNGQNSVETTGTSIGECLTDLCKQFPGMKEVLFNDKNKLKDVVEIYLNLESAWPGELEKKVKDGDEIHITLVLAGG